MRSFDQLLPSPLRRYYLLADAVYRMGPGWVAFRIRYWLEHRLGFLERRSPVGEWPAPVPGAKAPKIIATETLGAWLREHADEDRIAGLRRHADDIAHRRFDVFGHPAKPDNWHHDAVDGFHYDPAAHWSRVSTPEGADIKFIWEPSRFGWIFDLVRLHLLDPDAGADRVFWDAFDEWCEQNPPNHGVNWACGQEASIRLMAVVIAASGMRSTASEEQMQKVQRLAWVTAARVEANIAYARSQKNNHHASEAVGLLTASLLFPGHPATDRWRKLGERHLKEVCETLVFDDGGTSQYSTNYHRVFVHNFVWAIAMYRSIGEAPPAWLTAAMERATDFLAGLVEPISGSGPFFGHDDGAELLPLSDSPHRHLASSAQVARSMSTGVGCAEPPVEQGCAWFGLADAEEQSVTSSNEEPLAWSNSYPDAGVHVMVVGSTRVYIRAGSHRFRPSQDDMLHCDVWIDGVNVVADAGTASYGPLRDGAGMLDSDSDHNGPRRPERPLMVHASKFLWANWASGTPDSIGCCEDGVQGSFTTTDRGTTLRRGIQVSASGVTVTDTSDDGSPIKAHWRFVQRLSACCWLVDLDADEQREEGRFYSPGYGSAVMSGVDVVGTGDSLKRPLRLSLRRLPD